MGLSMLCIACHTELVRLTDEAHLSLSKTEENSLWNGGARSTIPSISAVGTLILQGSCGSSIRWVSRFGAFLCFARSEGVDQRDHPGKNTNFTILQLGKSGRAIFGTQNVWPPAPIPPKAPPLRPALPPPPPTSGGSLPRKVNMYERPAAGHLLTRHQRGGGALHPPIKRWVHIFLRPFCRSKIFSGAFGVAKNSAPQLGGGGGWTHPTLKGALPGSTHRRTASASLASPAVPTT